MNGRYAFAETPQDRLAIAVLAAERTYAKEFPNGVTPGQVFYAEFLRPFIEREILAARMDELHRISHLNIRERERELADSLHEVTNQCQKKV